MPFLTDNDIIALYYIVNFGIHVPCNLKINPTRLFCMYKK